MRLKPLLRYHSLELILNFRGEFGPRMGPNMFKDKQTKGGFLKEAFI
jgi:hypothetical protein